MKLKTTFSFLMLGMLLAGASLNAQVITTFDYTGDVQTYTVPPGITSIQIDAYGGQGQEETIEDYDQSIGGLGGFATGLLSVTPGEVLNIYVGGAGTADAAGYNGGGFGGFGTPSDGTGGRAGSGGGGSDVRQGGVALDNRVIVAGGGGGGGRDYVNGSCVPCGTGGNGGAGGALTATDGDDPWHFIGSYTNPGSGGKAGTPIAGGAGGAGTEGEDGNPGLLGVGGDGVNGNYSVASGAGGGGYYGGGAGAGANSGSGNAGGGGAGGSSYLGTLTDASTTGGIRTGNGEVIITELCIALESEVSSEEICEGEELLLFAESLSGGEIVWDDPEVTNGESFVPTSTGEVTYIATSDADDDCPFVIVITIHEAPAVTATASDDAICDGEEIGLFGGGADSFEWNYDAVNAVYYDPELGPGVYDFTVIGIEDEFGCKDSATVEVTINALPIVIGTSDQDTYCDGDLITLTGEGADTYEWNMDVEDGVAFEQEIGIIFYTVIGTDSSGCMNTDSIPVVVNANPEITLTSSDELLGDDGSIDLTVDSGEAPYTFDWDNDGTGDFDDDEDLTDLPAGTYTVVMTDANGCTTTATITIGSQVSIDEFEAFQLDVYPNPTQDQITVVKTGSFDYSLSTLTGQILLNGTATGQEIISLNDLATGVYFLAVTQNETMKTVKIVKK